jgi:hypothetical protein
MSAASHPRRGPGPAANDRRPRFGVRKHGATFTSYGPDPAVVNAEVEGFSAGFDGSEWPYGFHPEVDRGWWSISGKGGGA